jgi:hypothetical protein
MKRIIIAAAAVVFVAGSLLVGTASTVAAISLDTGSNRVNVRLRDQELAVNGVEQYITTYKGTFVSILSDTPDAAVLEERAAELERRNQVLQDTEFSPGISDEYTRAAGEVKTTAQALTDVVVATSTREYTDGASVDEAQEEIEQAEAVFIAATESLEDGAAAYSGSSLAPTIFLVGGGLVALIIAGILIANKRQKNDVAKTLFANDPAATQLSDDQKKLIVRLYRDVKQYEESLNTNNPTLSGALEVGSIQQFFQRTDQDSFGAYAGIAYEYRALVNARNGNGDAAKADIQKAAELRGQQGLVTLRGQQLRNA